MCYATSGQTLTRTAKAPATGEGDQTTTYFYNTIDNTSGVQSAEKATTRLLAKVRYPDHDDPQGTSGEVKMKFDLAGRVVERLDQRQTKVTTTYDQAGRQTAVYVDATNTTDGPLLGAKALGFTYGTSDQLLTATTWSDTDLADAHLLTKVVREYDGWGEPDEGEAVADV
jgi:YD repeat-containing protein